MLDLRAQQARDWAQATLAGAGQLNDATPLFEPASADASFRRYFRLSGEGRSWIVMDAPPQHEDCRPFIAMATHLDAIGLHVPKIVASELQQGFLLLSDLGPSTYLDVLNADNADTLFADAIDALVTMQCSAPPPGLAHYDEALLQRELALFPDWYVGRVLGHRFDAEQQHWWQQTCRLLIDAALAQPQGLVHRDFMPRNLMLSRPNPGVLDFQDAVVGPLGYDPVCLFHDAFLSWPRARVEHWLRQYLAKAAAAGLAVADDDAFWRGLDLIGAHRHLKVIGIFARICHRDGKPRYLQDVPRFFAYLRAAVARRPELQALGSLLDSLERRS